MENVAHEVFGDVISAYSRENALEDGVLVDVSTVALEAGIKFPVALTRAVWDKYVEVPEGVTCQDVNGRLWDILWMLKQAMYRSKGGNILNYQVYVRNNNRGPRLEWLKAICGPGDDLEPVITIMLPNED